MSRLTTLPTPILQEVQCQQFVRRWASTYIDQRAHLYDPNIGKRLTDQRLLQLFKWKNTTETKIAKKKMKSIKLNFIQPRPRPKAPASTDRDAIVEFVTKPGGTIFRIFYLHCCDHRVYPIFDQHVYRAMRFIQHREIKEIPTKDRERAIAYVEEYMPFHSSLVSKAVSGRDVDKALWSFGKFLKSNWRTAIWP